MTVKVIIDKISKRSKGYAFIEYATEEAASAALKEMNGKVDPSFLHEKCNFVLRWFCFGVFMEKAKECKLITCNKKTFGSL